jgi:DNA-binding transcriptional MocR family regulator
MTTTVPRSAAAWQDRYTRLPDALLDVLTPREHQVIHLLLSYRWTDDALIYPSIRTMAARLRCSDRTIQRTIRQLEARGYLVVVPRFRADTGQQSNLYQPGPLLLPLLPPLGSDRDAGQRERVTPPVTRWSVERNSGKHYTRKTGRERYAPIPAAASAYLQTSRGTLKRR